MPETKQHIDMKKLPERILSILTACTDLVTQKVFEEELSGVSLPQLLTVLNRMQREGQVEVLKSDDGTLCWRLREIGNIDKLKSLTDVEESLVYNCIRKNGNEGATAKAISMDTKLPQNRVPRLLKTLMARKLIKELPVLAGSKQKIYMLMELEPCQTLAANTLFAGDSGVDTEFVNMLRKVFLKYIASKAEAASKILDPLKKRNASYASVEEIHRFVTENKVCTVPLTPTDVKTVLDALVYGGELESKQSASVSATLLDAATAVLEDPVGTSSGEREEDCSPQPKRAKLSDPVLNFLYRSAPPTSGFAFLSHIPCILSLNKKRSHSAGVVCPPDDPFYAAFLDQANSGTKGPKSNLNSRP